MKGGLQTFAGSRKELRKKKRHEKRRQVTKPSMVENQKKVLKLKVPKPLSRADGSSSGAEGTAESVRVRSQLVNPEIAAEEREIARLDKLLGFDNKKGKSRSKIAAKLNKEYGMFEGMGDDFGDFLMDLDDLADVALGKNSKRKTVFAGDVVPDEDEVEEHENMHAHILDDDEQEQSDIDVTGSEENEDDEDEDENEERDDSEDANQSDSDGSDESEGEESRESRKDENNDHVYHPSTGEDIYGRQISTSNAATSSGAYIPPAKRVHAGTIDESSDTVKSVRRQMNGLMNRLSEQTKDPVLRSIKSVFDSNSNTVVSHVLRDCIMSACANPTQMMTSLIPVYASVVAALHFVVGIDIGAFIIEDLTNRLYRSIDESKQNSALSKTGVSMLVGDKLPSNCLLLLSYFYNLRILHHQLILDILENLVSRIECSHVEELQAELLVCLVDHCGIQLRGDDPSGLRSIISSLSAKLGSSSHQPAGDEGSRVRFLLESITDLKNNKSRRTQSVNAESIKKLRRWLGTVKTSFHCKSGDLCLRISLKDLLDAELHGRWWRAGASWLGSQANSTLVTGSGQTDNKNNSSRHETSANSRGEEKSEEQQLLRLAAKMRFNTTARKNIFVVVMSSRDVNDAFERLGKLDFKGKEDREIMRVLVECCGQEKKYNAFYSELAALLCDRNHQYKMTLQFCFWDTFKDISEGRSTDRRAMNLAHFLSHIVLSFHLPLSVIKPIDCSQLSDSMVLFLATFFLAIFSSKVADDTFVSVFDRVATTKDYAAVRDLVLTFLQTHFLAIPSGLDPDKIKVIEKRRLKAIKIVSALSVLDYAHD